MTVISIDPVTRIEGHGRVLVDVDGQGRATRAEMLVDELRGFERILVGMEADRMPLITARICGVCPSAHHLAAVNALDSASDGEPPRAARMLRELLYMGHLIHSHALSLFVLQGPDLLLGVDAPAETRNVVGLVSAAPEVTRKALRLRSLGQRINESVGGRGIHPVTAVVGGMSFSPDASQRQELLDWAVEALALAKELTPALRDRLCALLEEHPAFLDRWVSPSWSLATVEDAHLRFCQGRLEARDPAGRLALAFPAVDYAQHLVETVQARTYLKPVYLVHGGAEHVYRVGPLARINAVDATGTPEADAELARFRARFPRPCHHTLLQAWARAIELVHAAERAAELLRDPAIAGPCRVPVKLKAGRAVGHVEAPRGTLIHDYELDDEGIVRSANLIVATQQNHGLINQAIEHALGREPVVDAPDDKMLNKIEFAIRCFDPCLSCATHAVGHMPLEVVVRSAGTVVRTMRSSP